jgi:hypothetical protein
MLDARGSFGIPAFRAIARAPRALAVLTIVAGSSVGASASGAVATCGMVVEDTVVIDRDLRCPGPALIVRNPRTVVQLNGHVIESSRPCRDAGSTVGIVVEASAARANILGPGIVRGFATGIAITEAPQVELRDLRVTDSCGLGIAVHAANDTRARDLVLDRNGDGGDAAGAVRVDRAQRFTLLDSTVLLNDAGGGGAVDLRSCAECRVAGNRIVANHGTGIRLDVESEGSTLERNLVLGQRPNDIVDQGSDNLFALNGFERGDGVDPPRLWPLLNVPASSAPGVAGCGIMHDMLNARATITITCPQDPGLRAVRNSVVAYRLLNGFYPGLLFPGTCSPGVIRPAGSSSGGAVTCTNPNSVFAAILEVTCCLN